jgi:hypothetical protein
MDENNNSNEGGGLFGVRNTVMKNKINLCLLLASFHHLHTHARRHLNTRNSIGTLEHCLHLIVESLPGGCVVKCLFTSTDGLCSNFRLPRMLFRPPKYALRPSIPLRSRESEETISPDIACVGNGIRIMGQIAEMASELGHAILQTWREKRGRSLVWFYIYKVQYRGLRRD